MFNYYQRLPDYLAWWTNHQNLTFWQQNILHYITTNLGATNLQKLIENELNFNVGVASYQIN